MHRFIAGRRPPPALDSLLSTAGAARRHPPTRICTSLQEDVLARLAAHLCPKSLVAFEWTNRRFRAIGAPKGCCPALDPTPPPASHSAAATTAAAVQQHALWRQKCLDSHAALSAVTVGDPAVTDCSRGGGGWHCEPPMVAALRRGARATAESAMYKHLLHRLEAPPEPHSLISGALAASTTDHPHVSRAPLAKRGRLRAGTRTQPTPSSPSLLLPTPPSTGRPAARVKGAPFPIRVAPAPPPLLLSRRTSPTSSTRPPAGPPLTATGQAVTTRCAVCWCVLVCVCGGGRAVTCEQ